MNSAWLQTDSNGLACAAGTITDAAVQSVSERLWLLVHCPSIVSKRETKQAAELIGSLSR